MNSQIAEAIGLTTHPVALVWADSAPEGALAFKPGKWGCVMSLIASVAAKGRTAAFSRETYGCWGGGVGLGFGDCYDHFPGGVEGFCGFLADGNDKTERGRQIGSGIAQSGAKQMAEDFLLGERYLKSAETTKRYLDWLPILDAPTNYIVAKPLAETDPETEAIQNITFFVEPDALSALVILSNYREPEKENTKMAWAAGCQVVGILAYNEAEQESPRAVVGMTDISARKCTRALLGRYILSFTAPWEMFLRMEDDVENSFLQRDTWRSLQGKGDQ